ncbi:MAG TPA: FAD-dependent oxidoreductase [Xanthomonadaceae bacterium]|nr:FAD-dependent oxidoreductase [Xanthomonadaceae bacterium]
MSRSRWLLLAAILAAALALWFGGGAEYLSLARLRELLGQARDFADAQPWTAALGFALAYIAVTALSLPGAALMTLFAGAVFGLWTGLLIVSFASTIGATLAMLAARFVFRDAVRRRFPERIARIDAGVAREGGFYLFALRLVPVFPFFVINLAMGLTAMRAWSFYWVSQLGMLPGTFVFVNAGRELGRIESAAGILSPGVLLAFAALGLLPLLAKRIVETLRARRAWRGWKRPRRFDRNLVVIGAGSAGLVTAYIAATVRAKVTLIEKAEMGGDCLNRGCVPSKALLRAARAAAEVDGAGRFGVQAQRRGVDFAHTMAHVHEAIAQVEPHDSVERYQGLGVEVIKAEAKLTSPWTVEVDGRTLSTRAIVIAAGGRPRIPELPGLDRVPHVTSDTIWALRELPRTLLVLGGGPIGCELAQAFARLGSRVTIVDRGTRLLHREDPDMSDAVQAALAGDGVGFRFGTRAIAAHGDAEACMLEVEHDGTSERLAFDQLLLAVGRVPNVEGYGLDDLGLRLRKDGTVETDDFLRTQFPNVLCAGDVTGPFQLTHAGAHQAWYAAVNALFGGIRKFRADYRVVPACVYTEPEAARVGLTEREAREQGIDFEVVRYELAELDRAIAEKSTAGFVKVLVPPGKDRILGASVVAEHGGELIALLALAMRHKLGLDKVLATVFAYPTFAESIKYVAGERRKRHKPERLLRWVGRYHDWRRG